MILLKYILSNYIATSWCRNQITCQSPVLHLCLLLISMLTPACHTSSILMVSIHTLYSFHYTAGGEDEMKSLLPLIPDTELMI